MKERKVNNDMNKTFIMAKLKADETEIRKLINKGFEDPYDYLKVNSNLVIGNIYFKILTSQFTYKFPGIFSLL